MVIKEEYYHNLRLFDFYVTGKVNERNYQFCVVIYERS